MTKTFDNWMTAALQQNKSDCDKRRRKTLMFKSNEFVFVDRLPLTVTRGNSSSIDKVTDENLIPNIDGPSPVIPDEQHISTEQRTHPLTAETLGYAMNEALRREREKLSIVNAKRLKPNSQRASIGTPWIGSLTKLYRQTKIVIRNHSIQIPWTTKEPTQNKGEIIDPELQESEGENLNEEKDQSGTLKQIFTQGWHSGQAKLDSNAVNRDEI